MPTLLPTRRAARRAALALLLAAPLAPLSRAGAQAACAAGTPADYMASGFSCTLGGWTLYRFDSWHHGEAHHGAEFLDVDPAAVTLTPFVGTDAQGRATLGFDIGNFTTAAGSHGTRNEYEYADVSASLNFWMAAADPRARIVATHLTGAFDGFNDTPDLLQTMGALGGFVNFASPSGECLGYWPQFTGVPIRSLTVGGNCTAQLDGEVVVDLAAWSSVQRGPVTTDPVDGFVSTSLSRIELAQSTVPEPTSLALLAGGALALAAVRRRAARRVSVGGLQV
jgi:hypothetical protein